MNRIDMRNQIKALLGDDDPTNEKWGTQELNHCIDLAVILFSEVCPTKAKAILRTQIECHKVDDETNVITSASAEDQTSANTLLNEIKTDYELHRASTTYHRAADSTNTISAANASDLATSLALANELKLDINAHQVQSGVHMVDDEQNAITTLNAIDLDSVKALANSIKAYYNNHLEEESDGRTVYANSVVGDSSYIRIEAVEYPVGQYPERKPLFDYFAGNFLKIKTPAAPSASNELVYVYWQKKQTFSDSSSTIPVEYEHVITTGSKAYALLMRAIKQFHQATTDLDTAREELAKLISGGEGTAEEIHTFLENIADDVTDAKTALGRVEVYVQGANAPSTAKYLTDGDDKIPTVNVGEEESARYGDYALRSTEMAGAFVDEATNRLNIAAVKVEEVGQRIALQGLYSEEVAGYQNMAYSLIEAASTFWDDGQTALNDFLGQLEKIRQIKRALEKPQNIAMGLWI